MSRAMPLREPTRFIGRALELEALQRSSARLITLLGPAGIGKTRLARHFAIATDAEWDQGPWFVDLTDATDTEAFLSAITRTLGLSVSGATNAELEELIGRALETRGRMLLILDNLEQLLPRAARSVARWLELTSEARFLVTSRERLRIDGETIHELAPLDAGAELFIDRVHAWDPEYEPDAAELSAIRAIAERLDGLPLAIELAAARARVLPPRELLARLEESFDLLAHRAADRTPRQTTMYGAIDWSWQLLDDAERRALARLAPFRGGFDVRAAERVLQPSTEVVELLEALRDKSLLTADHRRLGMYEIIRRFAEAKLIELGEAEDAARLHARYYLELVSPPIVERENYRAILERGSASSDPEARASALQAAVILDQLSGGDGVSASELKQLERLLAAPEGIDPLLIGRALLVRATKKSFLGLFQEAEADVAEAGAIAERVGDRAFSALAHHRWGNVLFGLGRNDEALQHFELALQEYRALEDPFAEATMLERQGAVYSTIDRGDEALGKFEKALAIWRGHGRPQGALGAQLGIAFRHLELGRFEEALRTYEQCLHVAREARIARTAMLVTGYVGLLYFDHGRLLEALEYASAAIAEALEQGDARAEGVFLAIAGAVRASLDEIALAEQAFDTAEVLLAKNRFFLAVAQIHRGHLELAKGRAAASAGDLEEWRKRRRAAKTITEEVAKVVDQSDDARIALRILERALGSAEPAPAEAASSEHEDGARLIVPRDASWFRIGSRPRVDLSRRKVLRSLLGALADHREARIPEPIELTALIEIAWPGEKLLKSAALNRLHVGLTTLRSLGLKDWLERRGDGYRLAARVTILRPV